MNKPAAAQSEIRIGQVGLARNTPDYHPLIVLNMVLGQLGIIERYVVWLGDPKLAIWMIVAAVLWEGTPFYTMNFLAGLAVIPAEL